MAKQKKNQKQPSTAETDPITPTPDPTLEGQAGAPPEGANPVGGAVEPNLPAAMDTEAGDPPLHVNDVDTPPTGTEIVLSGGSQDVPDVTIEEPSYPAYEWQEPAEPALVLPNNEMVDEDIVALILGRQGAIGFRLRRDLEDYWVIGAGLNVLYKRHAVEKIGSDGKPIPSRWRSHWLPKLRINHTSDQQLRVFAEKFTLDEVGQFGSKTEALRACGFSIGGVTKAIEHAKSEAAQEGDHQAQGEPLVKASNEDAPEIEAATQPDVKTETVTSNPQAKTDTVAVTGTTAPQPTADLKLKATIGTQPPKIAANPASQPEEDDPIACTEALVITLSGAEVADMEAAAAESGLTLLAKSQDQIVGVIWYADDPHKVATERVGKALAKLRPVKKKFKIEARYLGVIDSTAV